LLGRYIDSGERRDGQPIYKKDDGTNDVVLYYWGDQDGPEQNGWWFGSDTEGNLIWCYNLRSGFPPPETGWLVPSEFEGGKPALISINVRLAVASPPTTQPPVVAPRMKPHAPADPSNRPKQPSMPPPAALQRAAQGQPPRPPPAVQPGRPTVVPCVVNHASQTQSLKGKGKGNVRAPKPPPPVGPPLVAPAATNGGIQRPPPANTVMPPVRPMPRGVGPLRGPVQLPPTSQPAKAPAAPSEPHDETAHAVKGDKRELPTTSKFIPVPPRQLPRDGIAESHGSDAESVNGSRGNVESSENVDPSAVAPRTPPRQTQMVAKTKSVAVEKKTPPKATANSAEASRPIGAPKPPTRAPPRPVPIRVAGQDEKPAQSAEALRQKALELRKAAGLRPPRSAEQVPVTQTPAARSEPAVVAPRPGRQAAVLPGRQAAEPPDSTLEPPTKKPAWQAAAGAEKASEISFGYYLKYLKPLREEDIVPCRLYDEDDLAKEAAREVASMDDDDGLTAEEGAEDAPLTEEEILLQAAAGIEELLATSEEAMACEEEVELLVSKDPAAEPKAMPHKSSPQKTASGSRGPTAPKHPPPPWKLLNAGAQSVTGSSSSSAGSDASADHRSGHTAPEENPLPPSNPQDVEQWVKKRLIGKFMSNPEAESTKRKQWHEITDHGSGICKCETWTDGERDSRTTRIRFEDGKVLWGKGDVRLDIHSVMGKRVIWVNQTSRTAREWEWVRTWGQW